MSEHLTDNGQQFSAFIDPSATVAVSDEHGNTINIRQKMSLQVRGQVQRALASYKFDLDEDGQVDRTHTEVTSSPQLQRLAMLQHNIVTWDGPAFRKRKSNGQLGGLTKVTPQSIARLNPDWPFMDKVYDAINELNQAPEIEEEGDTGDPFQDTE